MKILTCSPPSSAGCHDGLWPLACSIGLLILLALSSVVPAAEPGGRHWALLIGVNDYAEIDDLQFCSRDMRSLRDQLIASGFPEEQVFLLHDTAVDARYHLPNRLNIERQLQLVLGRAAKDDLVLVAFSGHGVHINGTSYLCPSDARLDDPASTMISIEVVYRQLEQCPAAQRLFIVDACREDLRLRGEKSLKATADTSALAKSLERPPKGVLVLTSCAAGQLAREDETLKHSVFINYVCEGLSGKADENHDGQVSLMELSQYASLETKTHVARSRNEVQTPVLRGDVQEVFELGRARPVIGGAFTNFLGMRLVPIPTGEFVMGDSESNSDLSRDFVMLPDKFDNSREQPAHAVRITRPFYMAAYEVTKGQFAQFVAAEHYRTDAEKDGKGGWGWIAKRFNFEKKPEFSWRSWGVDQSDDLPVVNVSWYDAQAFCVWLSEKESKVYRLPSEAEWEYACRAGTTTRFYNGNDPERLVEVAHLAYLLRAKDRHAFTCPVGRFQPNAFGLYDMHGNVWEWCSDWYAKDYWPTSPPIGISRVMRGGGWDLDPVFCRSAARHHNEPSACLTSIGFRVVCER